MAIGTHDKRDCVCVKYKPDDIWNFKIRMNGETYFCRNCGRYVSSKKWKGGLVELSNNYMGTRHVWKEKNWCPCCGQKMAFKRRSKNKLLRSIKRQIENKDKLPELAKISLITKQKAMNL